MASQFEQFNADELEDMQLKTQIRDALKRLMDNPDWKLVIDKEYFRHFTSEMMMMYANISPKEKAARKRIYELAISAGYFNQFLEGVIRDGDEAEEQLKDINSPLQ